jgi:N-acetylneuraminic acid mutarotase
MTASRGAWVAALLGLALAVAGCGSSGSTTSSAGHAGAHRSKAARLRHAAPVGPERLTYRTLFALPAPLRDPATAPVGSSQAALLGGLDAADVSTSEIDVISPHGVSYTGALPLAQHDAQAASLAGQVYVFGGGGLTELNHIVGFDPTGHAVRTVGVLPSASSDAAVTEVGGTAYIVGGYDGTNYLNTILAWQPGGSVKVVGHTPEGLRYSAVTSVGGKVIIVGGSTPAGASRAVYSFDPATGQVTTIGQLPQPVTHGGAAALGNYVYLVGGRGDLVTQTTPSVWSIDPSTGAVRPAGRLPHAISDAGVITVGQSIIVAGGYTGVNTLAGVGELVPGAA